MSKITHLLNATATLGAESGVSGYGDPTFAAGSPIAVRWEWADQIVVGRDNNQYHSTAVFVSDEAVTYTDRIWPPGANTGDANAAMRPIKIVHADYPDGTTGHYEVYL